MQSTNSVSDRLWRIPSSSNDSPSIPEWIEEHWTRHGEPVTIGSDRYNRGGRALIWFTTQWLPSRAPYRFALSRELMDWLNTAELDLTGEVTQRPSLSGQIECPSSKPISRFMYSIAEQYGRTAFTRNEGYYEFLAWYAFSFMSEKNVPGALLPIPIIQLLNTPAADEDIPLTVGMLLYLKSFRPDEYKNLQLNSRERLMALSFCAVQGILSAGHPTLIPQAISRFWRHRPSKLLTAFEYVATAAYGIRNGATGTTAALDEKELRARFYGEVAATFGALLYYQGHLIMPAVRTKHQTASLVMQP